MKIHQSPQAPPISDSTIPPEWRETLSSHWGFTELRPLQREAIAAALEERDSLVVMPTGGGKSLCYQAPAVLREETTVVVSPLISLMKDQVDSLQACGVAAVQINSSQSPAERREAEHLVIEGRARLVFVSPERLLTSSFLELVRRTGIRTFAIDEAHCISHWGHDFRPEYRQIASIRKLVPDAILHAYTATATERVRRDVIAQLSLRNPAVLVGNFDRPNLNYRVVQKINPTRQVIDFLQYHRGEAGIVYCLRRRDVDVLTEDLRAAGFEVFPYHAGLDQRARKEAQEAFLSERCDLIVATIAFGMGIDRSNIRFVLHTSMPKSIEHYQQETGRAGRDGLEADCVLLYSPSDAMTWHSIFATSADLPDDILVAMQEHLREMERYCHASVCRHRSLVNYFGQPYEKSSCNACDICLGDTTTNPDSQVIAQKILSCVARTGERFGAGHIADVLLGSLGNKVVSVGHDRLSTHGLLRGHGKATVRNWILQLVAHGVLAQEKGQYPILRLNEASWSVMRGHREVELFESADEKDSGTSQAEVISWEGVDRGVFETLRSTRRTWAAERNVPPYVVFPDSTLREIARVRPSTLEGLRRIRGVGGQKLHDWGEKVLEIVRREAAERDLPLDRFAPQRGIKAGSTNRSPARREAFRLFREGRSVDEVAAATDRARSTSSGYLAEFIEEEAPESISPWVDDATLSKAGAVMEEIGPERLSVYFAALDGSVSYDQLRLVRAFLDGRQSEGSAVSVYERE
jgi:ATP-dependent DNA helicase RecQ